MDEDLFDISLNFGFLLNYSRRHCASQIQIKNSCVESQIP